MFRRARAGGASGSLGLQAEDLETEYAEPQGVHLAHRAYNLNPMQISSLFTETPNGIPSEVKCECRQRVGAPSECAGKGM